MHGVTKLCATPLWIVNEDAIVAHASRETVIVEEL
jgi:hypothetical protein